MPQGRGRVSLLTGDPFRQESEQDPPTGVPSPAATEAQLPFAKHADRPARRHMEAEDDPVALAMALPPSSPLASSSQAMPSTPPTRVLPTVSSPRSPLAQGSPKKPLSSPPPSIKRKPVPSSSSIHATPKVKVYEDAKPAAAQPQTPAEVTRTSRRAKTRSDTAMQHSPLTVGRVLVTSTDRAPIVLPERSAYRNTYPPAPAPTTGASNGAASASRTAGRARMRAQTQRSSENEVENDLQGSLQGLEQDRRTWLARREDGGLDVTPPREGRFEPYLS